MKLEKAFDKQALLEELKAQGLPVLENTVEKLTQVVFDWVKSSLQIDENQLVKFAVPIIEAIEPLVYKAEDKIDGVANQ